MSPPVRGAWIEILPVPKGDGPDESPPVRGAWIEITTDTPIAFSGIVASREGGVD